MARLDDEAALEDDMAADEVDEAREEVEAADEVDEAAELELEPLEAAAPRHELSEELRTTRGEA